MITKPLILRTAARGIAALPLLALCSGLAPASAQQTPSVTPKTQEAPLPPAVTLPPPEAVPADVPSRPLTAEEAARIALRHQASVAVAEAGVSAATARIQQTRAALKPSLTGSAGYSEAERIVSGGAGASNGGAGGSSVPTSSGYQASVSLSQLLYDSGRTRDLVRQAEAQEQSALENLTRVQADLVLQVKQAFYTYVQNSRLVEINETNVRNQQEHLKLARARLKAGVGLPYDVVRAETAVAEAILNLTAARNNASNARVNLALVMGLDPRTPIQAAKSEEPAIEEDGVDALVCKALSQRPEVRQAQAALTAAQRSVDVARVINAPTVSATMGLSARGVNFPPANHFAGVGAVLQWTPFDGGLATSRLREAQSNVEAAQAQIGNAERAVVADVSSAFLNLRTAEQRVLTAGAGITSAEESLRLAEGRYAAGVGTFLDVLDAQAALLAARTQRVNAEAAVAQARASLARALGSPLK